MISRQFLLTWCLGCMIACCVGQGAQRAVENAVEEVVYLMGHDGQCLGPRGFQACDWSAMWLFARRKDGHSLVSMFEPNPKEQCLDRKRSWLPWKREFDVRPHKCSDKGAKNWDIIESKRGMVYVTQQNHKYCLARGHRKYRHTISMVACNKDPDQLSLQALGHPGILFETVDGMCFDGVGFKKCDVHDKSQYFSVGVRFDWGGKAQRYLYKYYEPSKCVVAHKNKVRLGSCKESGAVDWGWKEGRLTYASGQYCIARMATEEAAALVRCYEGFEYLNVGTPQSHEDYLEYLLQNDSGALEQILKNWQNTQQSGSSSQQQQQSQLAQDKARSGNARK